MVRARRAVRGRGLWRRRQPHLLRTYTAQIEALAKLRRGGEQRVRVEHVELHLSLAAGLGAKQGMLPRLTKNRCPARSVPLALLERILDFWFRAW